VFELFAGLFGLLIGSFLNVCIYRWPRDLSVVAPRSKCPVCGTPVAAYDNIPVLSYLILGGRCRHCKGKIHWRYPLVELLTAAAFVWFVHSYGLNILAAKYCLFTAMLIALAFTDLDTRILPNEITLGGTLIGFVFAFPDGSIIQSLAGALVCAGSVWLSGWIFEKLRHKEGLGLGDVKMLAMIGAFLGVGSGLLTIVVGSLIGSIVGLIWIRAKRLDPGTFQLPFGTFLAIAAFLTAIWGHAAIDWYVRRFL
jgi:leader peptidase (prepilin peptidase)/N-methyltransferase